MLTIAVRELLLLTLIAFLGESPPTAADPPAAHDQGACFSADAFKNAQERVVELRQRYQLPLGIETYRAIPDDVKKDTDLLDVRAREKLFADWAQARLQARGGDGAMLLICKEPSYIHLALGEKTRRTLITPRDRRGLVSVFITRFVDRQADDGLRDFLNALEETVRSNREQPPRVSDENAADELGAGGEAASAAVFGPRVRIAGVQMRGIRDVTPPPPTAVSGTTLPEAKVETLTEPQTWSVGTWLLVIAAGAILLALVLLSVRRKRVVVTPTPVPTQSL